MTTFQIIFLLLLALHLICFVLVLLAFRNIQDLLESIKNALWGRPLTKPEGGPRAEALSDTLGQLKHKSTDVLSETRDTPYVPKPKTEVYQSFTDNMCSETVIDDK